MKNIVYIIILMFCVEMLSAQDIIALRNGTRIENVFVLDISDTVISYKQDKQTLSVPRNTVEAILYANGKYETIPMIKMVDESFNETPSESESAEKVNKAKRHMANSTSDETPSESKEDVEKTQKHASNDLSDGTPSESESAEINENAKEKEKRHRKGHDSAADEENTDKEVIVEEKPKIDPYLKYQDGLIHHVRPNAYYYVDSLYKRKNIKNVLATCPAANLKYDNGHKLVVGGWSTVGVGIALFIVGSVLEPIGEINCYHLNTTDVWNIYYEYDPYYGGIRDAGISVLAIASGTFVAGIITAAVGHKRQSDAFKIFNSTCATPHRSPVSLELSSLSFNRIGITLKF